MRCLLDINVISALLDPDHDFHHRAHEWWAQNSGSGWASCPLTENGVVRIMSHSSYNPRRELAPQAVTTLLRRFIQATDHEFWPDSLSFLDDAIVDAGRVLGPRQITDLYLLALAASRDGTFVTFDESINLAAVRAAGSGNLHIV